VGRSRAVLSGRAVYALVYDARKGRRRLWAAVNSLHFGSFLSQSDDYGKTWSDPETYNIKFPEGSETSLKQIWQIAMGNPNEPDSFTVASSRRRCSSRRMQARPGRSSAACSIIRIARNGCPAAGGLCLHTILPDPANPERLFVAISTGGVYRTDDGGKNWQPRKPWYSRKVSATRSAVSRMGPVRAQGCAFILRIRTECFAASLGSLSQRRQRRFVARYRQGLPSDFGFAMEMDPHDANTVYIIPIESDEFRCTPEAKLRVYRHKERRRIMGALDRRLAATRRVRNHLRDGMKADENNPTGLYFGTRNGKLFGSKNGGDSWMTISEGLPAITCVKTATIN